MQVVTKRVADLGTWAVDDAATRLLIRVAGREDIFTLPPPSDGDLSLVIGAARDCEIVLDDDTGHVSRRHARIAREANSWVLYDLGSTNGLTQDGEQRLTVELLPGTVLEIGPVTLIVDSDRLATLRGFVQRVLGWSPARIADCDRALRCVQDMATLRSAFLLCGAGDLTSTMRRIHDLAVGETRPFVRCGDDGMSTLIDAYGGTLLVQAEHPPRDFASLVDAVRQHGSKVRLAISAATRAQAASLTGRLDRTSVVELPPLAARRDEAELLIREYAADAVISLGATATRFRENEMRWLLELELGSLEAIEELAFRVVALRNWGVTGGAAKLGISHVALSKWARRRRIPT